MEFWCIEFINLLIILGQKFHIWVGIFDSDTCLIGCSSFNKHKGLYQCLNDQTKVFYLFSIKHSLYGLLFVI